MPRGSHLLPEPTKMVHRETEHVRIAVTKSDHTNLVAAGYRVPGAPVSEPAPDGEAVAAAEAEEHERRSAAAQKAAETRRRNAEEKAAREAADSTNETTEAPSGDSGDADSTSA